MSFPLKFNDIIIWITLTCVILLATSGLLNPYHGQTNLIIEKDRLRLVTLIISIIFLFIIVIKIHELIVA